jgi:hypothetical protein
MEGVSGYPAICINLALMLMQSPNTLYSLLDPLDPTTPQKAVPVEIPIADLHLIFFNSSYSRKAVWIALTASF